MPITNDYGGVHENSGIVSLVFVLLSNSTIGFEATTQIFYDALAGCLSSHSNFCATRFCTVDAATDEMKPYVEDAWDTVGLTAKICNVPKLPCKSEGRRALLQSIEVLSGTSNKERSKIKGIRGRKKGTSEEVSEKQGKIATKGGNNFESKGSSAILPTTSVPSAIYKSPFILRTTKKTSRVSFGSESCYA